MICSRIQIDSLSKTVSLSIDSDSAERSMVRVPPRWAAPAELFPPPPPLLPPPDPPQPAARATTQRMSSTAGVVFMRAPCAGGRQYPTLDGWRLCGENPKG